MFVLQVKSIASIGRAFTASEHLFIVDKTFAVKLVFTSHITVTFYTAKIILS